MIQIKKKFRFQSKINCLNQKESIRPQNFERKPVNNKKKRLAAKVEADRVQNDERDSQGRQKTAHFVWRSDRFPQRMAAKNGELRMGISFAERSRNKRVKFQNDMMSKTREKSINQRQPFIPSTGGRSTASDLFDEESLCSVWFLREA